MRAHLLTGTSLLLPNASAKRLNCKLMRHSLWEHFWSKSCSFNFVFFRVFLLSWFFFPAVFSLIWLILKQIRKRRGHYFNIPSMWILNYVTGTVNLLNDGQCIIKTLVTHSSHFAAHYCYSEVVRGGFYITKQSGEWWNVNVKNVPNSGQQDLH